MSAGEGLNPQLVDRKGRLWQERTVVVKREEHGFGFTLTQEMPVFVDKVFSGSSAQRAGIQSKDRIIKVNGVSVMGHKHQDVVDMIKDSSHVTLTVISKLGSGSNGSHKSVSSENATTSTQSNIEISPPRQLQELTLQSLKTMLHKQRKNYESLSVDYSKQRSDKLEKELRDCESIIRILEVEIAAKSPAIESHIQTTTASVQSITPDKILRPSVDERTLQLLGIDRESCNTNQKPVSSVKTLGRSGSGDGSPKPYRAHTFSNGISPNKAWRPTLRKSDLPDDGSDDDLSDVVDGAADAGPFSSLQDLKGNPAHMSVFLHYLFMSRDPKHLLFYLVVSSYQNHCKTVEVLKQRGTDIYWTFLLDQAPLKLDVEDSVKQKILFSLENEESESRLKSVFVEVRESLSESIINDLGNYRHKRVLGLAAMFGDQLVTNQMPMSKQLDVATTLLTSDIKTCLDEKQATVYQECVKNQAIAACMATYLLEVLTIGNKPGSKMPSIFDKIQPFTRGDLLLKKGKQRKKEKLSKSGHNFQLTSFKTVTNCDLCGRPLWGVVYHGYQCTVCDVNIHKFCCINDVAECAGQGRTRIRNTPRKQSLSRKLNINVISVPLVEETVNGSATLKNNNSGPATAEDEEERVSPPVDARSPQSHGDDTLPSEVEAHPPVRKTRSRTISDTKQALAPPSSQVHYHRASLGSDRGDTLEQPKTRIDLSRTQSERLQNKPETLGKQRSIEALSWGGGELSSADEAQLSSVKPGGSAEVLAATDKQQLADEDFEELHDDNIEEELIPWALMARREVLQNMKRYEVARQENIRELVYTERTHLHKLKIMKYMYKIPLQKQNILSGHQAEQLFPSLEELILFHSGLCADLKERVGSSNQDTPIVRNIADVLLSRFDGAAGERLCHACSIFASNQAKADKLCKEWKRKNDRFRAFLKTAEAHPMSRRLTLTELMPIAWTRLTRYKLLIENVLHSYKKNWDNLEEADRSEATQVETAIGCVKSILKYVNKQVKWSTNRQKLADYQSKLDLVSMEKSQHPIAQLFKNLDLTAENRMLIHEGPLTWKIQHRKVVELHALLLTDILVLLEKQEDKEKEKYYLRTHTVESVSGTKEELSTVIRLKDCLLRTAAADRGGRTFLLVNNSNLMKLAQMYEFIAENSKEKKKWEDSIERAMMGTQAIMSPEIPSSPLGDDYGQLRLGLTSHLNTREQLDKIDDDMKRLMNDKLDILRSIQVGVGHHSSDSTPKHTLASTSDTPKVIVESAIKQTNEILSTVSHIMVPNPTKSIVGEAQSRLTDIIHELQRNLTKLMVVMKDEEYSESVGRLPSLDFTEDGSSSDALVLMSEKESEENLLPSEELEPRGARADSGSAQEGWGSLHERLFAIGETKEEEEEEEGGARGGALLEEVKITDKPTVVPSTSISSSDSGGGPDEYDIIVAPPDIFAGDNCATPTPGDFISLPGAGMDSGASTPRYLDSPSVETPPSTKSSPLTGYLQKADKSSPPAKPPKPSNLAQSSQKASTPNSSVDTQSVEFSKLSIAPRDSPVAAATSRVLSILSSTQHKGKRGDGSPAASGPRQRGASQESDESEEGTDM